MVPLRDGCNWRETPDWVVAWICGEANFWQNVLQNYFHDQTSSIGARTSTSAQRRSKNIVQLDSIIACSQRSKEFCNTIPSESRRSSPILLSRGSANNGHSSYCSCTDRQLVEVLPTRPRRGGRVFFAPLFAAVVVPLARRKLADCAQPVFNMVRAHELVGFDGVNIDRHESE